MLNFTIKQKLLGLGGIVVAVFMIFFIVYLYGSGIGDEVAVAAERDMVMEEAETGARIAILRARQNEKDFLMKKDRLYIDKHAETMQVLYQHLKVMQENIHSDQGMEAVEQLLVLSHKYEAGFQSMVNAQITLGLNGKSGLIGNLHYAANNIENTLKKLNRDELMVQMLMMRRHEKDYLARGGEKHIGQMAQSKGRFGVLLSDSGLAKKLRRQIRSNLNSYYNDFNALVRGMKEIKIVIADFHETVNQAEPAFDRVETVVHALRHSNELFYEQANQRVTLLYVVAMIIGGIVIIAGVVFLGREISRGLDKAVQVCKKVAEGRLGLGIDTKSNDEIGQLFSSMKYMDENLMHVVNEVQDAVASIGSASQQITQGNAVYRNELNNRLHRWKKPHRAWKR